MGFLHERETERNAYLSTQADFVDIEAFRMRD